jgi:hypothetical protein
MGELVAQLAGVVFLKAETAVELSVEPNLWRVIVLHQHPLPDIEFATINYQWILDVLLHHVLGFLA